MGKGIKMMSRPSQCTFIVLAPIPEYETGIDTILVYTMNAMNNHKV